MLRLLDRRSRCRDERKDESTDADGKHECLQCETAGRVDYSGGPRASPAQAAPNILRRRANACIPAILPYSLQNEGAHVDE